MQQETLEKAKELERTIKDSEGNIKKMSNLRDAGREYIEIELGSYPVKHAFRARTGDDLWPILTGFLEAVSQHDKNKLARAKEQLEGL